jgi:hypothetical protein
MGCYTYRIEYELSEPLTQEQRDHMSKILHLPWTGPPGYTGEVLDVSGPNLIEDWRE